MVQFNNASSTQASFTVTIEGDKEDYLSTIKALLTYLSQVDEDTIQNQSDRYSICFLISSMLPDSQQIMSVEEMKLLQAEKVK